MLLAGFDLVRVGIRQRCVALRPRYTLIISGDETYLCHHHLIYIDNKLQARRHGVVDWKRDLCRRDHGGCWRKGICFHIILFFGRRDRDFHFEICTFVENREEAETY